MAAFLSSIGTDWLLKRAFKFLLKRNLGCLLRNEVCGRTKHAALTVVPVALFAAVGLAVGL